MKTNLPHNLEQLLSSESEPQWENQAPLPLQRELPATTPFPMEALGPHLQPVAQRLCEAIQTPPALGAQSVLAAAALAAQGHANIIIDGKANQIARLPSTVLGCLP